MNVSEIREIIALMDKSTLSVLEVRESDVSLRLERTVTGGVVASVPVAAGVGTQPTAAATPESPEIPGAKTLLSPMVGTFHMLPDQPLTVGTEFKRGDVLCAVEAMKLMNEITAEEDGEILWQAVEDGAFVEYGQLILQYQPK